MKVGEHTIDSLRDYRVYKDTINNRLNRSLDIDEIYSKFGYTEDSLSSSFSSDNPYYQQMAYAKNTDDFHQLRNEAINWELLFRRIRKLNNYAIAIGINIDGSKFRTRPNTAENANKNRSSEQQIMPIVFKKFKNFSISHNVNNC